MKEQKINIGNNQDEKIVTKELKINKNVFIYNETVIPLSNISRIHVAVPDKKPLSLWHILGAILGVLLITTGEAIWLITGIVVLSIAILAIYNIYKSNQDPHEYLVLNLNSGKDIYLYSKDHKFSIDVMDVIINCINSGKQYKVNMENCKIQACQFGDGNMMKER